MILNVCRTIALDKWGGLCGLYYKGIWELVQLRESFWVGWLFEWGEPWFGGDSEGEQDS